MKIIDENGAAIENPDLTLGYLVDDTEPVEHPAVEGVEEVSHYETVAEYPNGGKDVQRVVDVPGVPAQAAWTEQMPVQRYIRYTAEELAAQEEARKKQEAKDKLPETVAALHAALADVDALNVDQDYRLTLLELGVTDDETTESA
jgi:ATPase subunit of ABC transporter with duplicated ATPase domains